MNLGKKVHFKPIQKKRLNLITKSSECRNMCTCTLKEVHAHFPEPNALFFVLDAPDLYMLAL